MNDIFAEYTFGKVALEKFGEVAEGFRLYEAERMEDESTIRVVGAVFRPAKTGPNKGKPTVMVKHTKKMTYVTDREIREFERRVS